MTVQALKHQHKIQHLLQSIGLPRSVYYYQCQALKSPEPYANEMASIERIFHQHKGRYGYRRIHYALCREGIYLNHKTVQRLMAKLGLKSTVRPKKYRSYKGEIGRIAPNVLKRDFKSTKPNEKWVTDVTEFKVAGEKVYLSPIIDLFNQEVVSHTVSTAPKLHLVTEMLEKATSELKQASSLTLHSDQGWQYQHRGYRNKLKEKGITQSMSRKGNCLDNAVAENFFAILKTESYHGYDFDSAEQLMACIDEYIDYYNNDRIKVKLKGLTPVEYRNQALEAA